MRTRIPSIARKETLHVLRDWRTLAMAFVFPMVMILLFGYGITFDIKHLRLSVADEDQTKLSRSLVRKFTASEYFIVSSVVDNTEALPGTLVDGKAQVAIGIPQGFAKSLERGTEQNIQVLIDGSESNTATIGSGYLDSIIAAFNIDLVGEYLLKYGIPTEGLPPVEAEVRVWFNPLVDSPTTIIPGLLAAILILISALLTSLTVVRERERGSLESLFATPVRKHEILIGKMIPYMVISLIDCGLVALIGLVVFDVPFNGSVLLYFATGLIFTFTGLSIGILASVVSSNQLLANQIAILTTMLPSILLSGFMFPIESMPGWVQTITYVVPARYFVSISRGIMLKAQPWSDLVAPTALLLAVGLFFFGQAMLRFKKKL